MNANQKVVKMLIFNDKRLYDKHNIKEIEGYLQEDIEKAFTGKEDSLWWQHTDRNIFLDLMGLKTSLIEYIETVLVPSIH